MLNMSDHNDEDQGLLTDNERSVQYLLANSADHHLPSIVHTVN